MGYAINKQNGMRAVDQESDCLDGETYHDELPSPWPPAPSLADQKAAALAALAEQFAVKSAVDITDGGGSTWTGGLQSALNIDGATRLAAAGGAASIEIFDASNIGHVLDIEQATAVAAAIGAAYQAVFQRYQEYKVAIAGATDLPSLSAAIEAASWEDDGK